MHEQSIRKTNERATYFCIKPMLAYQSCTHVRTNLYYLHFSTIIIYVAHFFYIYLFHIYYYIHFYIYSNRFSILYIYASYIQNATYTSPMCIPQHSAQCFTISCSTIQSFDRGTHYISSIYAII